MDTLIPKFSVISLFPEMIKHATSYGVLGRALDNSLVALELLNPREFSDDARRTVDEPSYGGGPGMVMQVAPLRKAIVHAQRARPANEVIYLSPQGQKVTHRDIKVIAENSHTIFLCGRYEGIDQRVIDHDISRELSVGDFVMSGGEFAALCILDAVTRLIPGALGNDDSAASDSFHTDLLDHPHYTRPEQYDGQSVPEVLLSGDHAAIRRWRRKMALGNTLIKRPDLLARLSLSAEDEALLADFRAELVKS
ncbi:MAG: tRNA (guanosine(37)-N1)-methyltransferase TrmD [Gammaproteobacteria bacterium]